MSTGGLSQLVIQLDSHEGGYKSSIRLPSFNLLYYTESSTPRLRGMWLHLVFPSGCKATGLPALLSPRHHFTVGLLTIRTEMSDVTMMWSSVVPGKVRGAETRTS